MTYRFHVAIGLLLTIVSAADSAYAQRVRSADVPADNRLFISGGSADELALLRLALFSTGLCEPSTATVYTDSPTAIDAFDYVQLFMVSCSAAAGTPFAGQAVLIAKESARGEESIAALAQNVATATFLSADAPDCAPSSVSFSASGTVIDYETLLRLRGA